MTPRIVRIAQEVLEWVEYTVSMPHPDLGRPGPICPFVAPSVRRDALYLIVHDEVDGHSKEGVRQIIRDYKARFLSALSDGSPEQIYNTLLVIYPNIPPQQAPLVDTIARELKTEFVQQGLMLGEFHKHSRIEGVHNPDFHPMVSPYPMLVIRHMSVHDILFLHQEKIWFDAYNARFGDLYRDHKIPYDHTYATLYYATKARMDAYPEKNDTPPLAAAPVRVCKHDQAFIAARGRFVDWADP